MRTEIVLDTVEMAHRARGSRPLIGLVTHSDAGSQSTSVRFTERLDEIGARPSIGTVADAIEGQTQEWVERAQGPLEHEGRVVGHARPARWQLAEGHRVQ